MKFSIVLPVLNGEENMRECLDGISGIDYSANEFEVIAIDDGSKDSTGEIMEEYQGKFSKKGINYTILTNEKNLGRIISREKGARKATGKILLFIDNRAIAHKDILRKFDERDYEPLVGNLYQEPDRNLVSRLFWMFRRIIYRPYFGMSFPDVYIDRENFHKISKGFCPFFCEKSRLLRNLPQKKDKYVNDDTAIFHSIVREKRILKVSDCRAEYIERASSADVIRHIFERGPRFVDFYFLGKSKFSLIVYGILIMPIAIVGFIVLAIWSTFLAVAIVALVGIGFGVLLCRSVKDVFALYVVGPIIAGVFSLGVYKGVVTKLVRSFQ